MLSDLRIDQFPKVGLKPLMRPILVLPHRARIPRHIGGEVAVKFGVEIALPRRGPGAAGVLGCSGNGTMISPFFTAGQTVSAHGSYLVLVALLLFLAPGLVQLVLPSPAALDWWTRLLALPLLNLGILCIGVGRAGSRSLVKLTVAVRLGVLPALAALVALELAPMIVLFVGLIDLVSAVLTLWGLAAEREKARWVVR